jgi:hypothetical protein
LNVVQRLLPLNLSLREVFYDGLLNKAAAKCWLSKTH